MKTLLLLRHGKAQPDAPRGDKERSLTERGRRDGVTMGRLIGSLVPVIDLVTTSDTRRTLETANIVASSAGYTGPLDVEPDIYGAGADTLLEVVRNLPDKAERALLIGHNPGFEDLASELTEPGVERIGLPTAGLAHIEFDVTRWAEVEPGRGRLKGVHSPKSLQS
jgi:phosphohistidine phosphatase